MFPFSAQHIVSAIDSWSCVSPFCADTAKFALPLSVVSGARGFVTECPSCRRHLCFFNGQPQHLKTLKNCARVDNTWHFDNESNLAGSEGLKVDNGLRSIRCPRRLQNDNQDLPHPSCVSAMLGSTVVTNS